MPTFLGTLTLDQQASDVSILEAGEALLAQHNHAVHLDPAHHESHAHLTVAQNGTILDDTTAHSCDKHKGVSNGAPIAPEANSLIAKHTIPEVVVPSKVVGKRITTNQAIVLENAAHGFVKPNILDVKLGVRLWADDAAAEKKIRFDKVSAETTHKDLGFRIAGMRVWQGEGAKGEDIDGEGYKIFDKNYGRVTVTKDNVVDAFRNFIFSEGAGVDEELGKLVSQAFLVDVERIQKVLEEQESRMFSASLLFVFEGDGKALRAAMEEASSPNTLINGDGRNGNGADVDEDEDEDNEDEETGPKVYTVKVIDFAHAEWTPGTGPDENSLKGVRSVATILRTIASS
jgi:inositol-polyphosphate multikinase